MLKFTQTGNLQEGIEKDLASKYYSLRIKHLKEIDYSKDLKKTHSNFVQKSRWSWICFPKKSFSLNYKMLNEVERKINSKKKILKIPNSVSKDWLSYSKNTRRKSIRRQCQEWILGYFLQKNTSWENWDWQWVLLIWKTIKSNSVVFEWAFQMDKTHSLFLSAGVVELKLSCKVFLAKSLGDYASCHIG